MIAIVAAILPVFLLIFLGSWLKRMTFPGEGFWAPAGRLTDLVFFPALIVTTLARADLAGLSVVPMAAALIVALLLTSALLVAGRRWLGVDGPGFTSVVRGAIRANAYIGLSIAAAVWGSAGVTVAAICVAVIVPAVKVIRAIALARWGAAAKHRPLGILKSVATDPLILAALVGVVGNLTGVPGVVAEVLEVLGRAALPIGLLCVGAALDWAAARGNARAVAATTALKLLAMPALTAGVLWAFGVEGLTAAVALLFMASPTAPVSTTVVREQGGDASLMAGAVTLQTAVSMATLPVILTLAG